MSSDTDAELRRRVDAALREIGASPDLPAERGLAFFADATELALAHVSRSGREHFLIPAAAGSWRRMRTEAEADGVTLVMISGYRGFDRQLEIIRERLAEGLHIDAVLSALAPPGCSEHHSGRAADVGTPGCEPLSEAFERTRAFEWLDARAGEFGFRLSYPRDNSMGYRYEPWHWCFTP